MAARGLGMAGALAWLSGCSMLGGPAPPPAAASSPPASPRAFGASPSPTPSLPAQVWVLTPLGLNLHSSPGETAARVAVLDQGTPLTVEGSQSVGAELWLKVKDQDTSTQGWVLDRSDLLIDTAVSLHFDTVNGYQLLYPSNWSIGQPAGQPGLTTFTSPAGTAQQDQLVVEVADDVSHLETVPTEAGVEIRQESPVLVYGQTTHLTVYRLNAGGYEIEDRFLWSPPKATPSSNPAPGTGMRALLFLLKQPGDDTSLFKQLLGGVLIQGS